MRSPYPCLWFDGRAEEAAEFGALGPGQSGILALVRAGDVDAVKADMPQATKVRTAGVDEATAKRITEASKEADAS